jgi:hypothetical protein
MSSLVLQKQLKALAQRAVVRHFFLFCFEKVCALANDSHVRHFFFVCFTLDVLFRNMGKGQDND